MYSSISTHLKRAGLIVCRQADRERERETPPLAPSATLAAQRQCRGNWISFHRRLAQVCPGRSNYTHTYTCIHVYTYIRRNVQPMGARAHTHTPCRALPKMSTAASSALARVALARALDSAATGNPSHMHSAGNAYARQATAHNRQTRTHIDVIITGIACWAAERNRRHGHKPIVISGSPVVIKLSLRDDKCCL